MPKQRVTISVEVALLRRAQAAVQAGVCRSLSEWTGQAMTEEEIAEQRQRDRDASAALRLEGERRLAEWQRLQVQQAE